MKVLVCGDVKGRLDAVFARVQALNKSKHGPFDVLFCVGQFFDSERTDIEAYLSKAKEAPIPTHFITAGEELPECMNSVITGGEICPNINYLGQAGLATVAGLTVAFLSGVYDPEQYRSPASDKPSAKFSRSQVEGLLQEAKQAGFAGVDALLTADWGRGVHLQMPASLLDPLGLNMQTVGCPIVSSIATQFAPRYHFCASEGFFFERLPYRNPSGTHVTRFIALGGVPQEKTSDKKRKWVHALNLAPMSTLGPEALNPTVAGITDSPYACADQEGGPDRKRQRMDAANGSKGNPPGGYKGAGGKGAGLAGGVPGMTADMVRRLEAENEWLASGQGNSSFFFNAKGGGKNGGKGGKGRRPSNFQSQRGDAAAAQDASHSGHKVFVGGISFNIDASGLWDTFSAAGVGEMIEVRIVMKQDNPHHSRGFGFITMNSDAGVARAVELMNATDLDGRPITVNHSVSNNSGGDSGGGRGGGKGGAQLFDARPRQECWFCLASPKVEAWLISSVGQDVYLATPKGALLGRGALGAAPGGMKEETLLEKLEVPCPLVLTTL
jgi:hypothetical protein